MLTFADFVAVRRAIDAGRSRDVVLAERNLTPRQWIASQRLFLHELALEAQEGQLGPRTQAFRLAFPPPPRQPSVEPEPKPAPPPKSRPAYLEAALAAAEGASPVVYDPTGADPSVDTTQDVPAIRLPVAATPFTPTSRGAPPPAAALGSEWSESEAGETAAFAVVDKTSLDVTPFETGTERGVDETVVGGLPTIDAAALPFAGTSPVPPSTADFESGSDIGETSLLDPDVLAAVIAALPFEGAAASSQGDREPAPSLDLNRYASLIAELDRVPGQATLARYGLNEASFVVLKAAWSARFANDPGLYGAFRRAHDAYGQWLDKS